MSESSTASADDKQQESGAAASGKPPRKKAAQTGSSGRLLTGAALLIGLGAAGVAGWSVWQLQSLQQAQSELRNDIRGMNMLSERQQKLIAAADRQEQLLHDLESSLDNGLSVVPDLSMRVRRAEQQLDEIPGVNIQRRSDWLRKEALYYLRIANTQAVLAGDAQVATAALRQADEKLLEAGDPDLTPVRGQISRDLAALKAVPVIDQTGMAFKIQSLADQVPEWPFKKAAPEGFDPAIAVDDAAGEELSPWQRLVATVKEVLSNIVSIKQTDAPPTAQLAEADEVLIIETLRAELQIARLALVGGDNELYRQSLTRAQDLLRDFFDTKAAAVKAADDTLGQLLAVELPDALPDISGSLAMMLDLEGEPDSIAKPPEAAAPAAPAPAADKAPAAPPAQEQPPTPPVQKQPDTPSESP